MKTETIPLSKRVERWREPRFAVSIEIEVEGIDVTGRPFVERTQTRDISEWGCGFYLSFPLEQHSLVAIRVTGTAPYCLPHVRPVMFMVAHLRELDGKWVMGASKIEADRMWDVEVLANPPSDQAEQRSALPASGIDNLDEKTLDSLAYGAIQLDKTGKVLKYNQYESNLANRKKEDVIGKNFFREVAPCTAVKEFYGRFEQAMRDKKLSETFEFEFNFKPKARHVLISMLYSEKSETVWVFVQALKD